MYLCAAFHSCFQWLLQVRQTHQVAGALQALTFNKIAPMQQGRIDIKYRRIACQVPTDMSVIVDANVGAGGWIRLQVKVCMSS